MEFIQQVLKQHHYEIKEQIGEGGFGKCYVVESKKYSKTEFVCKIVEIKDENGKITAERELKAMISLSHPNIIKIYNYFQAGSYYFMILEYCKNGTLEDIISKNGKISNGMLSVYVPQIISALTYLHSKGIAHNDVKPSNVFLDKMNRPILADFGLATTYKSNQCTQHKGTVLFLAPEVFDSIPYNAFKADVWSFGIMLFFFITGYLPFQATSKADMKLTLAAKYINLTAIIESNYYNLIKKCLNFNSTERPDFKEIEEEFVKSIHSLPRIALPPICSKKPHSRNEPLIIKQNLITSRKMQKRSHMVYENVVLKMKTSTLQKTCV